MSRLEEEEVRTVNRSDGVELFSIPPEYFDDVTTIYHLAGYIGGDEKENQKTNVEGTRCILEQARKFDVKSFIFASSAAVYGSPRYLPIDEEHPTNPISPYGRSKLQAEG
ncbi:MAG: SDR family oxidoreductase, partial [Methanocellales archaeon]|nr:SDR family oxidoreductase [Methanocellales archaeon]